MSALNITDEMLQAAIRKAIEAGLLPRHACREDAETNKLLMRLVLQEALAAVAQRCNDASRTAETSITPNARLQP